MPDVRPDEFKKEDSLINIQPQNTVTLRVIIGSDPKLSLMIGILIVGSILSIIMGAIKSNPSLIIGGIITLCSSVGFSFFLYKRAPEIDAAKKIKRIVPVFKTNLSIIEQNDSAIQNKFIELESLNSTLHNTSEKIQNLLNQREKPSTNPSQHWESRASLFLKKHQDVSTEPVHSNTIKTSEPLYQPVAQSSETSRVPEAKQPSLIGRLHQLNLDFIESQNIIDEQNKILTDLIKSMPTREALMLEQEQTLRSLDEMYARKTMSA